MICAAILTCVDTALPLQEEIMLLNQQLEDVNSEAEGHNETLQAAIAARREAEVERDNLAEQVGLMSRISTVLQAHAFDICDVTHTITLTGLLSSL